MKITFISIGKQNDQAINSAVEDYTKRIGKYFKAEWKIIPNSDKVEEGEKILKALEPGDYLVALDEKGKELNTIELSQFIEKRMIAGDKKIVFAIGGAYGLGEEVLKRADFKWSLSKLTFPHQLVRLILSETIYRSISVLKNEPYHHE